MEGHSHIEHSGIPHRPSALSAVLPILFILGLLTAVFLWLGGAKFLSRFLPHSVRERYGILTEEDPIK